VSSLFRTPEFQADAKASFEEAWRAVVRVGLAAHRYGSTATRVESFLVDRSNKLGFHGVCRSTPLDITSSTCCA
jgi:hypothetical protein